MSKHNFNRNFAIIIGINNYKNGIRKLKTAVPDARKLAEIIKKQHHYLKDKYQKQNEYKVQLLLNEEANFDQLKDLIADFKKGQIPLDNEKVTVTEDDRILFYFAGHGIALDALENQEGPVGYLIPQDATFGDSSTYLPMQDLHDALNALPCRHMLAILDCCFAGAFRWASLKREIVPKVKVYKERYDRFISDAAWQVITSAADNQKALDYLGSRGIITEGKEVHSPFAKALFDALRGGADEDADLNKDGIITATELYLYLRDRVEILTENNYKRQTPSLCPLRKHDKGEFIFLLPDFDRDELEDAPSLNPANNPYKGLQSYDEKDSNLFFGREKSITKLFEHVVNNKQAFTIVVGASGTGKSSLVKAGLLPYLHDSEKHKFMILAPMRPGESPFKALAQVCLPITDEDAAQKILDINQLSEDLKKKEQDLENIIRKLKSLNTEAFEIIELLKQRDNLIDECANKSKKLKQLHENLTKTIEDLSKALEQEKQDLTTIIESWSSSHSNTKLLLPVDQFEELITLCKGDEEREQFQKLIRNAIAKYPDKIHVVITLRLDFEAQFQTSVLKDFWNDDTRFVVPPMTQDELREVIEKPALEKVLYFDPPSLVDDLINEVVQMPGALPLLSFTLSELYLKYLSERRDNRALTKEDYEELGRVFGSIIKRANQEYEKLVAEDSAYEDTVRRVMLRMISLQGGELARRQVPRSELVYLEQEESDRVQTVIERLSLARLIVEGSNPQGEAYVEPAHDALVQGWDKILRWKNQEQEILALQRFLIIAVNEWTSTKKLDKNDRATGYLWHDNPRLAILENLLTDNNNWLNKLETEFVKSSISKRDEEYIQEKKQIIRILYRAAEAFLTSNQQLEALVEAIKAGKEFQKLQRKYLSWKDSELCTQVRRTLQKILYQIKERNRLQIPNGAYKIVFSPNGQLLAIVKRDGRFDSTVSLLERNGKLLPGFEPFNVGGNVSSISFSPDSQQLITITIVDDVVKWWSFNGQKLKQYKAPTFNRVVIGSNGRILVFGSDGNKTQVSDLESGSLLAEFPEKIDYAEVSPNGKLKVINEAGTNSLWDIDSNQKLANLKHFLFGSNIPNSISFSADSQLIATAGYQDDTICLWNSNGHHLAEFKANQGGIIDVSFSPDGKQLATVGIDNTIRIWQDLEGKQLREIIQYQDKDSYFTTVTISSDGKLLAVSDSKGILTVWNLGNSQKTELLQQFTDISELHFSPDNRSLAISKSNGTIHWWDLENQQELTSFTVIKANIDQFGSLVRDQYGCLLQGISFSEQGEWLAIGGDDNITVRNCYGQEQATFSEGSTRNEGMPNWVQATAFDPSGNLLATSVINASSSINGLVRLWNWKERQPILPNPIEANKTQTTSVIFSPQGNLIATAGLDGSIPGVRLWNLSGEKLAEFKGHQRSVNQIIFSPDGKLLATASLDGTIRIWDLYGQQIVQFQGLDTYTLSRIAFTPDSKQLVTTGIVYQNNDSSEFLSVKWWQIEDLDELLVRGCEWVRDYLNNNPNVDESDRRLCDDVPPTTANPNK